jgi:hypothetical protein
VNHCGSADLAVPGVLNILIPVACSNGEERRALAVLEGASEGRDAQVFSCAATELMPSTSAMIALRHTQPETCCHGDFLCALRDSSYIELLPGPGKAITPWGRPAQWKYDAPLMSIVAPVAPRKPRCQEHDHVRDASAKPSRPMDIARHHRSPRRSITLPPVRTKPGATTYARMPSPP